MAIEELKGKLHALTEATNNEALLEDLLVLQKGKCSKENS
jgi:hypothetical protein